jgi:hypothetical protein
MNAQHVLSNCLQLVTPSMHKVRRSSLLATLQSVMGGAAFSVTCIGRNLAGKAFEKHRIKRVDRLCSNPHLYAETDLIYTAMVSLLVAKHKRPIIHVDWSDLDESKQHFLIRASLAAQGRSLTLYEEVHTIRTKEKPKTHATFLAHLATMLPNNCRPIIFTDAGFRIPWFELVASMGWDYLGRVRNRTHCRNSDAANWKPIKTLYAIATATAKELGIYQLGELNNFTTRFVIYHRPPKGRKDKTANGVNARQSKRSRSCANREKEPWLIATSLSSQVAKPKAVVKMYATRMQIEEAFRDVKTGLGMNQSRTRNIRRLRVLFMIAALAQFVLYLTGLAVKAAGKHYRYQANSIKHRNVLSNQMIGLRAYRDRRLTLKKEHWQQAIDMLKILSTSPVENEAEKA